MFSIQGHRGSRGTLPENTIASFQAAVEGGADTIEMDLLITQDGRVVIHHNHLLNPLLCTTWEGDPLQDIRLISEVSYKEIAQLDCGRKPNPHFPEQRACPQTSIPTLQDVLEWAKGHHVRLNLELKVDPFHPELTLPPAAFAEKVWDLVKKTENIYFSSFHFGVLEEIRKKAPKVPLGLVFNQNSLDLFTQDWIPFILATARRLRATIVSPEYSLLTEDNVRLFHAEGLQVIPWTVNTPTHWQSLIQMGVHGIITDYPAALVQFRQQRALLKKL